MKKRILLFTAIIIFLSLSCKKDTKEESIDIITSEVTNAKNQNLNISLLLDLSDRINPEKYPNQTMDFYKRDIAYIKMVSDAFISHLKQKKVILMNDKIQLYFDPEPKNQNMNMLSDSLKYKVTKKIVSLELFKNIEKSYKTKPQKIYEAAINDNAYIGSDTWRFIKNKVNDFCISKDHRNILVILTDGYVYHKNIKLKEGNQTSYLTPQLIKCYGLNNGNWKEKIASKGYGFIPANKNLEELEILVLGINPDPKNPYEQDVILKYWEDWLDAMKVKRYEIKTALLPSNMDKIIKDFILN